MDPLVNDHAIWLLELFSRNLTLLAATQIALVVVLVLWRFSRYHAWPSQSECACLIAGLLALNMAGSVVLVLTFTYPPRFEYLSQLHLKSAGLFTAIMTLYHTLPGLRRVFFPEAPSAPPGGGSAGMAVDEPSPPPAVVPVNPAGSPRT
jgi:hypothetical protein